MSSELVSHNLLCRQIFEQTRELQYLSCCMDPIDVVECMSDTQCTKGGVGPGIELSIQCTN